MTMSLIKRMVLTILLTTTLLVSGCGYNSLQAKDEAVNAAWSEVENQYQRRADLVPNLVNVVKGYAKHEKDVLVQVTQARASVASLKIDAQTLQDPAAFQKFQQAQAQLGSALSRLIAVSENYPDLKANQQFLDLQAQLEGTENRIAVARKRYISTVQDYNTYVRQFPQSLTAKVIGMKTRLTLVLKQGQRKHQ
jgi:LemA protein